MSSSRVPHRMRAAHPSVFTPKTFFFSPLEEEYGSDWADCFSLKAAAVYSAIFRMDADELLVAEKFLKCIAFYCINPVKQAAPAPAAVAPAATPGPSYENTRVQSQPAAPAPAPKETTGPSYEHTRVQSQPAAEPSYSHEHSKMRRETVAESSYSQEHSRMGREIASKLAAVFDYSTPATTEGFWTSSQPSVEPEPVSIATLVDERRPTKLPKKIKEACDAVYIVVAFLKDFKQWAEEDREKIDSYLMLKHGPHLVSDMALLDNQLLLDHAINVVQNLDQAVVEVLKFTLKDNKGPSPSIDYLKLPFNRENFHEVVSLFCWYYSPFYAEKKFQGRFAKQLNTKSTLLECLHNCLVRPTKDNLALVTTKVARPIPTAKELAWSGMRFEADPDGTIQVQFTEPVFKMPALVFDTKIETVVRNLMALESSKPKRPLTRYFQLMNELVDDEEDVRVLKWFGVVRGRWKREEEVVNFVKSAGSFASHPSMYPAVEDEIGKVRKWHDERSGKFLVRYGWALGWASLAAAIIVVTAIFAFKRRR